jgi:hypothetical protein
MAWRKWDYVNMILDKEFGVGASDKSAKYKRDTELGKRYRQLHRMSNHELFSIAFPQYRNLGNTTRR